MDKHSTIITYQEPKLQMVHQSTKPIRIKDICEMSSIFKQPVENMLDLIDDKGIVKIFNTQFSLNHKEIDEKKLMKEEGEPAPTCQIYYVLEIRSIEGELINRDTSKNQWSIKIGVDSDKSLAIHLALQSMRYGERSVFRVKPYYQKSLAEIKMYRGDFKVVNFQSESQLAETRDSEDQFFILSYVDYKNTKKQPIDYSYEERVQKAQSLNQMAKSLFSVGSFKEAEKQYKMIQTFVEGVPKKMQLNWTEQQKKVMKDEQLRSLNNMGISLVKAGDYIGAKKHFENALLVEEKNIKSNYFIGRCYYELNNIIDAKQKFEFCLKELELDEPLRKEIEGYMNKMKQKVDLALEKKVAKYIIENMSNVEPEDQLKKRKEKYEKSQLQKKQDKFIELTREGGVTNQEELMNLIQQM